MASLSNPELSETSSIYSEGHDAAIHDSKAKIISNPLATTSQDFSFVSSLKPERHDKYALLGSPVGSNASLKSRTHSYSHFADPKERKSSGEEHHHHGSSDDPSSQYSTSSRANNDMMTTPSSGEGQSRLRLRVPKASSTNAAARSSMISQYSGIVHDVDIDTIKYVVDKNSLNDSSVSEVKTISSKSKSSKSKSSSSNKSKDYHMANISQLSEEDYADTESIIEAVKLPTKKNIPTIDVEKASKAPDKSETTDMNFTIPPRSPRRPASYLSESGQIDSYLIEEAAKHKRNSAESGSSLSGNKDLSDFKKLPPLPLQGSDNESTRSVSSASKRVSVKIDDIMKEFEDLKSELEKAGGSDDTQNSIRDSAEDRVDRDLYIRPTMTSESNTRTTTASASFHTADSIDLHSNGSGDIQLVNTTDSSPMDHYEDSTDHHGELPTTPINYHRPAVTEQHEENDDDYADIDPEIGSFKSKTRQRPTSSGTTNKKKKKQKKHNKMKPFSYDTLAKLLNATDGIVIGQELNEIEIPQEEKYLIEQIVDSISRLTASMIVNPTRYNQGCNRLQKVLDVLEGFAG